jgi:hypothetical protein
MAQRKRAPGGSEYRRWIDPQARLTTAGNRRFRMRNELFGFLRETKQAVAQTEVTFCREQFFSLVRIV